ncbi:MAG TPA: glycosyl transferase family protein, partial [Allosphingosinicella sp.]|nr:glycosyl transferase family protein [Allosphingosinicella sp.]
MDWAEALLLALDFLMHEAALFAAAGFLVLGLGDVAVDAVWLALAWGAQLRKRRGEEPLRVDGLPPPQEPGLLAVFIPAWDEAAVIGTMLRHTLAAFGPGNYLLYVGCYPNDPATIEEVRAVRDSRVRLVVGPVPGPTTKADCLNRLWAALRSDEREGLRVKAVVLHDAEDVVHSAELRIFDSLSELYDLVQLPVVPLIHPKSLWVSGHYADEFAESHAKELVVRQWVGAAVPSAGVGCAFSRQALARMAEAGGGLPFDADSLTEDYEFGLKLRAIGGSQAFVRIAASAGGPAVSTKEYFPATLKAAVSQKARWMTGIALSGWDRLGWAGGIAERWMRLRDRQSVLAALLFFSGYLSFGLWTLLKLPELLTEWEPRPISPTLALILTINLALLVWRLGLRFG